MPDSHWLLAPTFQIILSISVVLAFGYSYFANVLMKSRSLDFYHLYILLNFITPLFIVSLFAYDERNIPYVYNNFLGITEAMPTAFSVSALGGIITLAVSSPWADRIMRRSWAFTRFNVRAMEAILSPKPLLILSVVTCVGLAAVELASVVLMGGNLFDLRGLALGDERIRPFFNLFAITLCPLLLFALTINWLKYRRSTFLILAMCLTTMQLVTGSRGSLIGPIISLVLCLAQRNKKRLRLSTLAGILIALVLLGVALGSLRIQSDGSHDARANASIVDNLVFANNFSDVRDFAWILSKWDNERPNGKTYLAGALGFLPRSIVPYRQEYALALYLNQFLRFPQDTHAGLRPGPYGEAYLNFGIPGVLVLSFVLGLVLGDVRYRLEKLVTLGVEEPERLAAQMGPLQLSSVLIMSAGIWTYYTFLIAALTAKIISFTIYPRRRNNESSKIQRRWELASNYSIGQKLTNEDNK